MCGIIGVISKDEKHIFDIDEIKNMRKVQEHRGPNDNGIVGISLDKNYGEKIDKRNIYEGKSVVAFNRLSILDLSDYGHQPMMNKNKNVILTFNGEIYNYEELRSDLKQKKYVLKGNSDTEILLNLYLEYGMEKMLTMLNGMFAIVIYDLRIGQVFLSRDRFGIKPLYIANTDKHILYSSEIKSFLKFSRFKSELDEEVLQEYILFRDSMSGVLLKNVEMINPGEFWRVSLKDNIVVKKKFFDINSYERICNTNNFSDIEEGMWNVLEDSIKRQMLSDVKVGCQLSGGIDSSLVSYIATSKYGLSDTFSIVVDDSKFSEEQYMDLVGRKIESKNHKHILEESYYAKTFTNMIWNFESIAVHASTLGIYQLAEIASGHVTVLLSGEGADEVFGGYKRFVDLVKYNEQNDLDIVAEKVINAQGKVRNESAKQIYPHINIEKYIDKRKNLYKKLNGSVFDKHIKYEMSTYLSELLIRQDKMTMAHSIENRVPMLDNKVVDYAFQIPENMLLNKEKEQGKYVLKKMAESIFGAEFAYRKKMGFGMPTNKFLMSSPQFVQKTIDNMIIRGIVDGKVIEAWSKQISLLKGTDAELFLKMIGFEIWCELFLDKKSVLEITEGFFNTIY